MTNKLKILIATDFTKASETATEYAVKLFSNWFDKEIIYLVMHAFKPMAPYANTPSVPVIQNRAMMDEYNDKLNATVQALKKKLGTRSTIKPILETGALNAAVEGVVQEEDPDLIVMGSREKTTFERMTLGSNTIEVASSAKRPVLAVPREADLDIPERILLVGDSERLDIPYRTLEFTKELITGSNARFEVLYVFKSGEKKELQNKMKDTILHKYFAEVQHSHHPIISSNTYEAMMKYAEKHKPNLLIANPSEKSFFEKVFHTSLTEKMVYHTKIPILILNRS